jgi:hypothetical protein
LLGIGDSSLRGYTNEVVSIDNQMPIGSSYMNDLWHRFLGRCRKGNGRSFLAKCRNGNGKDTRVSDHTELNDVEQLGAEKKSKKRPEEPPEEPKEKKDKDQKDPDARFLGRYRKGNGKDTRAELNDVEQLEEYEPPEEPKEKEDKKKRRQRRTARSP